MTDKPSPRIYGTADDSDPPPPPEGLRGEQAAAGQEAANTRIVNGMTITEASGVAAAELSRDTPNSEEDQ
jgi:hypothetical protein